LSKSVNGNDYAEPPGAIMDALMAPHATKTLRHPIQASVDWPPRQPGLA
jgi:hypothetical protein